MPVYIVAHWHAGQPGPLHVEIKTERLCLRSIALEDLERCLILFSSSSMATYAEGVARSAEKTKNYVKARCQRWRDNNPFGSFIIFTAQGEFVGHADLDETENEAEVELGYILMEQQQGKGYARECAQALICAYLPALQDKGYQVKGRPVRYVSAVVLQDNIKSITILQGLGMKLIGEVKRYSDQPRFHYRLDLEAKKGLLF